MCLAYGPEQNRPHGKPCYYRPPSPWVFSGQDALLSRGVGLCGHRTLTKPVFYAMAEPTGDAGGLGRTHTCFRSGVRARRPEGFREPFQTRRIQRQIATDEAIWKD